MCVILWTHDFYLFWLNFNFPNEYDAAALYVLFLLWENSSSNVKSF